LPAFLLLDVPQIEQLADPLALAAVLKKRSNSKDFVPLLQVEVIKILIHSKHFSFLEEKTLLHDVFVIYSQLLVAHRLPIRDDISLRGHSQAPTFLHRILFKSIIYFSST
jgi:hypothetical protein